MKSKWEPTQVESVPFDVDASIYKELIAEFAELLYHEFSQLPQTDSPDSKIKEVYEPLTERIGGK